MSGRNGDAAVLGRVTQGRFAADDKVEVISNEPVSATAARAWPEGVVLVLLWARSSRVWLPHLSRSPPGFSPRRRRLCARGRSTAVPRGSAAAGGCVRRWVMIWACRVPRRDDCLLRGLGVASGGAHGLGGA
jgi:hypothetical protein